MVFLVGKVTLWFAPAVTPFIAVAQEHIYSIAHFLNADIYAEMSQG